MKPHFPPEQHAALKEVLWRRFKAFPLPPARLNPISQNKKNMRTVNVIRAVGKKYANLYHLGNLDVPSNFAGAQWYGVVSATYPVRPVPILAWGENQFSQNSRELEFDILVTGILIRITESAPSFLSLTYSFAHRAPRLAANDDCVLKKLLGS